MAFNGTQSLAKNELVARLEAIGMQFGGDLNARTSFDETVYMLNVPTDVPQHLETAVRILAESASRIALDPEEMLANRDANPLIAFGDAFNRLVTGDHPRARPPTIESVERMSLEKSLEFYRELYSNPAGATFVFVGAFRVDGIRPLVEQYIGGLPTEGEPRRWRDHGVRVPHGKHEEIVRKGLEPRAQTRIAFNSEIDMDDIRNSIGMTGSAGCSGTICARRSARSSAARTAGTSGRGSRSCRSRTPR